MVSFSDSTYFEINSESFSNIRAYKMTKIDFSELWYFKIPFN